MSHVQTTRFRLSVIEHGAAVNKGDPAIVLLHGLLFDGGQWDGQIEPLAALGRVLVVDGPGHGQSDASGPFTLEQHADALAEIFEALAVKSAVLVGLSWGGMLAMRFALQHADRVAALALLDTDAGAEEAARRFKYKAFVAYTKRFGVPEWLMRRQLAPVLFGAPYLDAHPRLVAEFTKKLNALDRTGLAHACLAVVGDRTDISDEIHRIVAPTLVLCGRDDEATPLAKSEAMAARIPGAMLRVIDGAGHMSAIERPDAVNEELASFVKDQLEVAPSRRGLRRHASSPTLPAPWADPSRSPDPISRLHFRWKTSGRGVRCSATSATKRSSSCAKEPRFTRSPRRAATTAGRSRRASWPTERCAVRGTTRASICAPARPSDRRCHRSLASTCTARAASFASEKNVRSRNRRPRSRRRRRS